MLAISSFLHDVHYLGGSGTGDDIFSFFFLLLAAGQPLHLELGVADNGFFKKSTENRYVPKLHSCLSSMSVATINRAQLTFVAMIEQGGRTTRGAGLLDKNF